jgi:hypothetical protein
MSDSLCLNLYFTCYFITQCFTKLGIYSNLCSVIYWVKGSNFLYLYIALISLKNLDYPWNYTFTIFIKTLFISVKGNYFINKYQVISNFLPKFKPDFFWWGKSFCGDLSYLHFLFKQGYYYKTIDYLSQIVNSSSSKFIG